MLIYETLAAYSDMTINNWSELSIGAQENAHSSETPSDKALNDIKPSAQLHQIVMGLLAWTLKNQPRLSHSVWCQAIISLAKMIKKSYAEKINDFLQEYMRKVNEYLNISDLKSVSFR